jgi:hypothetical protein
MITIQAPDGSERHAVDEAEWANGASVLDAGGNETNPYVGWTQVADGSPPRDGAEIVDGAWVVPLQLLQDEKWEEVKALRTAKKEAGVAVPNIGTVQTDDISTQNITGLVVMANLAIAQSQPFSEPFTMADNTVVVLDGPTMVSMGVAVGQYVSEVYARARDLREAIYAAADEATLDAIDVEGGWPS